MEKLLPRYFYSNDYNDFYELFLSWPHTEEHFKKGKNIWDIGTALEKVFFIKSGIAIKSAFHENGYRRVLGWVGSGTLYPIPHRLSFQIESSLMLTAISDVSCLSMPTDIFMANAAKHNDLLLQMLDTKSCMINFLLYDCTHQRYNDLFIKLCNCLYLLVKHNPSNNSNCIDITQKDLSDLLGVSRNHVTRYLSLLSEQGILFVRHKSLEILDIHALHQLCTEETIET